MTPKRWLAVWCGWVVVVALVWWAARAWGIRLGWWSLALAEGIALGPLGIQILLMVARRYGWRSWRSVAVIVLLVIGALSVVPAETATWILETALRNEAAMARRMNSIESIPRVEGIVVEETSGEPVVGAKVGRFPWKVSPGLGLGVLTDQHLEQRAQTTTDQEGRFRIPRGPGGGWSSFSVWVVWRKGAAARRFQVHPRAGGGWIVTHGLDISGHPPKFVEARVGPRSEMVLRIRVQRMQSPHDWAEYFRTLQVLTKELELFPPDTLLDEASRYVSHNGEITEEILWLLIPDTLPWSSWQSPRWSDARVRTLARAQLDFCRLHPDVDMCGDLGHDSSELEWALQRAESEGPGGRGDGSRE